PVLAGCCRSLLGDGPSRHYPCTPCVGAWTHTPPSPPGAFAHFFPAGVGLCAGERRLADGHALSCNFNRGRTFEAAVIRFASGSHARLAPRLHPPRTPSHPSGRPPSVGARRVRTARAPRAGARLSTPGVLGSGPSYVVSVHRRLLRPHPPVSRARCDFTAQPLIRSAFAVRERLGDPRNLPYFHCRTVHTCRRPYAGGSTTALPLCSPSRYQTSSSYKR